MHKNMTVKLTVMTVFWSIVLLVGAVLFNLAGNNVAAGLVGICGPMLLFGCLSGFLILRYGGPRL